MPAQADNLASFIEAFEEARALNDRVALDDFLPAADHPLRLSVLRELVCIDLEHHWRKGKPRSIEDYRRHYPELFADSKALRELLFEDYRLRQQALEEGWVSDGASRFRGGGPISSSFINPLSLLPAPERDWTACFPDSGDVFAGFRLVLELGRGAFGRVFLAEQEGLANRRVVLKIARNLFNESQVLAQLQHSYIVPIYSTHSSVAGTRLQAVCMPCLGAVTLADILKEMAASPQRITQGKQVLAIARKVRASKGMPGPAWDFTLPERGWHPLRDGNYVEAVLWLGMCLAEGLAHAHERGLLHRDLKPANVLLTDDGRPMLLDFNLAEDMKHRNDARAAWMGGTLPHMPPEQLEAFQGQPRSLDGRVDVFSLGSVLFELLVGQPPQPISTGPIDQVVDLLLAQRRKGTVDPGCYNAELTPAVRAILRRCLEPDPERRYSDARQLQEDLRRQLEHQPLRYIREPSLRERLGKWFHRNRQLVSVGSLGVVALLAVLLLGGLVLAGSRQVARAAAVEQARRFMQEVPRVGLFCLTGHPGDPVHLEQCENRCQELLAPYRAANGPMAQLDLLPDSVRQELASEIGYLFLLWARVRASRADVVNSPASTRAAALALNEEAERYFATPPMALCRQRAELLEAVGEHDQAVKWRQQSDRGGTREPRDLALLAAEKRQQGKLLEARALLEDGLKQYSQDVWLWYDLGLCQGQLGDDAAACACFNTCLALAPDAVAVLFQRGLAHLRQRDHARALADLDRVVMVQPELIEARVNRALALAGLGRTSAALADLDTLLSSPPPYTRIWFLRASLRQQLGDATGAAQDRAEGLQRQPRDELSWVARAYAQIETAPRNALEDLDRALALEPRSRPALQNKAHLLAERLNRPADAIAVLDEMLHTRQEDDEARSARGVLYARLGQRDRALADARACLRRPDARILYRLGCLYALTSRQHGEDQVDAINYLQWALKLGWPPHLLSRDRDLDPLREEPSFQKLVHPVQKGEILP